MIGALALAGCGGGTDSVIFLQEYADAENEFDAIKSTSPTASLPSGTSLTFNGLAGMTFDINGASQASGFGLGNVIQQGGDYLAVAHVEITANFDSGTFTGRLYNFDADEGHTIGGEIDITGGTIDGSSKISASLGDDNLTIDNKTASIDGTITDGYIVGTNGESLWGSHSSTFSYGTVSGTLSGGLYASQ